MYYQVETTWKILLTIVHSIMVHERVSENFIHLALMYTTDHIFLVLPIRHMENEGDEPNKPEIMVTGTKTSVSNLCILYFPCVVQKVTSHVDTKALNMCHQSQFFWGIFRGIPQHQK